MNRFLRAGWSRHSRDHSIGSGSSWRRISRPSTGSNSSGARRTVYERQAPQNKKLTHLAISVGAVVDCVANIRCQVGCFNVTCWFKMHKMDIDSRNPHSSLYQPGKTTFQGLAMNSDQILRVERYGRLTIVSEVGCTRYHGLQLRNPNAVPCV